MKDLFKYLCAAFIVFALMFCIKVVHDRNNKLSEQIFDIKIELEILKTKDVELQLNLDAIRAHLKTRDAFSKEHETDKLLKEKILEVDKLLGNIPPDPPK